MKQWEPTSIQGLTYGYKLPTEIIQSENYHFYSPLDLEMDTFHLLAFIKHEHRNDVITFRFWRLAEEWLTGDFDILDASYSGRIRLKEGQAAGLIELLKQYADELDELLPASRVFRLIHPEEYPEYFIPLGEVSNQREFYLISEPEGFENEDVKLVEFIFGLHGQTVWMSIVLGPKEVPRDFELAPYEQHEGELHLTRQGLRELCMI